MFIFTLDAVRLTQRIKYKARIKRGIIMDYHVYSDPMQFHLKKILEIHKREILVNYENYEIGVTGIIQIVLLCTAHQ